MILPLIAEQIGFDRQIVGKLTDAEQRRLALKALLALMSSVLFGISAAYLAYIETYDSGHELMVGIGSGIGVFLFALNIQRLFVTSGGFGMSRRRADLSRWSPDQLRLFTTFVLAVLLSQPLLLMLFHDDLSERVRYLTDQQIASFRQSELNHIDRKQGPLIVVQQRNIDKLRHAGVDLSALVPSPEALELAHGAASVQTLQILNTPEMRVPNHQSNQLPAASSRRKALVIGVQAYWHAPKLNNPVKDAKDISDALRRMGYQVTVVQDPKTRSADIFRALDTYIKSIKPGDISVFYFSGHGFQMGGTNYLAPSDLSPENIKAALPIGLHSVIEEIGNRSPRASVFFIDACSSWADGYRGGLRGVNADVANYYAVLAATPGQSAADLPPNTNSLYTQVLRKYLEQPITLSDVVSLTGGEVRSRANSMHQKQQPIGYGLISEVSFSLVDAPTVQTVHTSSEETRKPAIPAASSAKPALPPTLTTTTSTQRHEDTCLSGNQYDTACLMAAYELTARRLVSLAVEREERLEKAVEKQREFLKHAGHLEDRFQLQWSDPFTSITLSVLLTVLLWIGDLARDADPVALRAYESGRYDADRNLIKDYYKNTSQKIHSALSVYPQDSRERLPIWDYDKDFFHEPNEFRRPDHRELHAALKPDSVIDLLHDMGYAQRTRA